MLEIASLLTINNQKSKITYFKIFLPILLLIIFKIIIFITIYSYLVTPTTKEMRFEVKGEIMKDSYLTIGIEGSSSTILAIILI